VNRREAEQFVGALRRVRLDGGQAAAATVVRVHGSAYRREGTRMHVRQDGSYECALSGGCLEPAVAAAAARVLETGEPALVAYDLADDSVWGLNLGCSGAVDILIERLDDDDVIAAWLQVLERGDAAVLVTPLGRAGGRRIVRRSGPAVGRLTPPALESDADAEALDRLAAPYPASGTTRLGEADVFFEVNHAPPALVVFGAGHDAVPLVRQAWALGFDVTVVDARAAYLRADLFPGASLACVPFDDLGAAVTIPPGGFVVVMNHHLDRDRAALALALTSAAAYIGVLGPRPRFVRLIDELRRQGRAVPEEALARVRSPVGLALGAETPEEVAMAVVAEMLAVQRGFTGGPLSGAARLHQPAATRSLARS